MIEAYRTGESCAPSSASIAGLPEQIGLKSEDVLTAFLTTANSTDARAFVDSYVQHMQENIDPEFTKDAIELARRHLIDQMYFAHAPVEMKEGHPITAKAIKQREKSKRLIVEAMMEVFEESDFYLGIDESLPANKEYIRIREEILRERQVRLPA